MPVALLLWLPEVLVFGGYRILHRISGRFWKGSVLAIAWSIDLELWNALESLWPLDLSLCFTQPKVLLEMRRAFLCSRLEPGAWRKLPCPLLHFQ